MAKGSSSSSQASTQTTQNFDQDTVVEGGSIGVGAGGIFATSETDNSIGNDNTVLSAENMDMSTTSTVVSNTSKEQTVTGDSNTIIGDNSSYILKQMDDATENVLLSSISAMSQNANNFMNLTSELDPEITSGTEEKTDTAEEFLKTTNGKILIGAVALAGIGLYFAGKGNK